MTDPGCVYCGCVSVQHRPDGSCLTRGNTKYLPIGNLKVGHTQVGDRVCLYSTDRFDPVGYPTMCFIDGTVACIDNLELQRKYGADAAYLLGWRVGEKHPANAWDQRQGQTHPDVCKSLPSEYTHGMWVDVRYQLVRLTHAQLSTTATHTQTGMRCAIPTCGVYNEYAQPNQPDNSYICFSCRTSGRTTTCRW